MRLGLPQEEIENIRQAAELHDLGKVAIPDAILFKPGPLTDSEWAFIRRHTVIGERIIGAAPALHRIAALVRASHENLDGTGYPDGLMILPRFLLTCAAGRTVLTTCVVVEAGLDAAVEAVSALRIRSV